MATVDTTQLESEIQRHQAWISALKAELAKVVVGQEQLVERLLIGLVTNTHVLLEGMPGLAKTLIVNTLSRAIKADFRRIQFTPDLLPADLVGTLIYNPRDSEFKTKLGPVFANLILADEINRAPAKVQSALLEAMQERQVTLGDQTFALPDPFLVLATQNPLEQEGTYQLPEAQLDRFIFKLLVPYPSRGEELLIQERMSTSNPNLKVDAITDPSKIIESREVVNAVYMDQRIKEYAVDLVRATRSPEDYELKQLEGLVRVGASPRATISLTLAAKALAFLRGSAFATPQEIQDVARDVLRHRVIVSFEAEAQEITSERIIETILQGLPVP